MTGHFSGSRKATRSSQIFCNSSRCTPFLIPYAMTPGLRTWSTASALTRQMKRPARGWPLHAKTVLCDLPDFQMKHIHHHKRSAIEQNDVSADYDMFAIRWRRRKMALQIPGADHNLRSQAGRQRTTHH